MHKIVEGLETKRMRHSNGFEKACFVICDTTMQEISGASLVATVKHYLRDCFSFDVEYIHSMRIYEFSGLVSREETEEEKEARNKRIKEREENEQRLVEEKVQARLQELKDQEVADNFGEVFKSNPMKYLE